jgi:hypothetical protein
VFVHRWLAQDEIDSGQRDGLTMAEREELSRLRRELRVVREERDVLAKAIAFFTKALLFARPSQAAPHRYPPLRTCMTAARTPSNQRAARHRTSRRAVRPDPRQHPPGAAAAKGRQHFGAIGRTLTAPYYGSVLVGVLGVTEAIS